MGTTAERLEIVRIALAEVGVDPQAVLMRGGVPYWRPDLVDAETAWRAGEIGRQWAERKPRCFACFKKATYTFDADERLRIRDTCQCTVIFTLDCGADR